MILNHNHKQLGYSSQFWNIIIKLCKYSHQFFNRKLKQSIF